LQRLLRYECVNKHAIGAPLHAPQFRPYPPHAADHARDGSRLTDRVWSIEEIVGLLEMAEKEPAA
jgi:hypothetical protein